MVMDSSNILVQQPQASENHSRKSSSLAKRKSMVEISRSHDSPLEAPTPKRGQRNIDLVTRRRCSARLMSLAAKTTGGSTDSQVLVALSDGTLQSHGAKSSSSPAATADGNGNGNNTRTQLENEDDEHSEPNQNAQTEVVVNTGSCSPSPFGIQQCASKICSQSPSLLREKSAAREGPLSHLANHELSNDDVRLLSEFYLQQGDFLLPDSEPKHFRRLAYQILAKFLRELKVRSTYEWLGNHREDLEDYLATFHKFGFGGSWMDAIRDRLSEVVIPPEREIAEIVAVYDKASGEFRDLNSKIEEIDLKIKELAAQLEAAWQEMKPVETRKNEAYNQLAKVQELKSSLSVPLHF